MQYATHASVEQMLDSLPAEIQDMKLQEFFEQADKNDEVVEQYARMPFQEHREGQPGDVVGAGENGGVGNPEPRPVVAGAAESSEAEFESVREEEPSRGDDIGEEGKE